MPNHPTIANTASQSPQVYLHIEPFYSTIKRHLGFLQNDDTIR